MSFGRRDAAPMAPSLAPPPSAPSGTPDGFGPAFWTGLAFAILAPAFFWQVFWLVLDALGALVWSADPWNTFGPGPVLNKTELNELASRSRFNWALRMGPAAVCALAWCLAHVRRRMLAPFWVFVLMALALPCIVIVIGSLIHGWQHDRQTLDWAFGFLFFGAISLNPAAVAMGFAALLEFLTDSFRWLVTSFNPRIQEPLPLFYCTLYVYLPDLLGTWFAAWLMDKYAHSRGDRGGLVPSFARDFVGIFTGTARAIVRLAGFGEQPATPAQQVARAVARPWLIPAACAFIFIVINGILNLFPIALALSALLAYAVTRGIWSVGSMLGITRFALGGALIGIGSAILIAIVCFTFSAQAWVLRLQVERPPHFAILISYLPIFVAMIASLVAGARNGFQRAECQPA